MNERLTRCALFVPCTSLFLTSYYHDLVSVGHVAITVLLYYSLLRCRKRNTLNKSFVSFLLPSAAFKLFQSFGSCLPPVVEKANGLFVKMQKSLVMQNIGLFGNSLVHSKKKNERLFMNNILASFKPIPTPGRIRRLWHRTGPGSAAVWDG